MKPKDRICLALDVESYEKAEGLVKELSKYVGLYKIGKELFTSCGPKIIEMIQNNGGEVFLDLKYHDIPNTVAKAARAATKLGVFMLNIHCSGGLEMMKKTVEEVRKAAEEFNVKKPLVLGVTVLTSIDQEILNNELRVNGRVEEHVVHLTKLAKKAGLDGVICSPKEIKLIKEECGNDFLVVTPGIRPSWAASNDQKRITTPKQAISDGADFIVIGRAITAASDRVEAAKKVLDEISN